MIANQKISEFFTLYDLTVTSHAEFQEQNRDLSAVQIEKLTLCAVNLADVIRNILNAPVMCNSGYRCLPLNTAIGSVPTSQHPLCEAVDLVRWGCTDFAQIQADFNSVLVAARAGKFKFGQLILESAERSYGNTTWIHASLGAPYRDPTKCGEVLQMQSGVYTLLETIPQ